jgi:hypothetical protein
MKMEDLKYRLRNPLSALAKGDGGSAHHHHHTEQLREMNSHGNQSVDRYVIDAGPAHPSENTSAAPSGGIAAAKVYQLLSSSSLNTTCHQQQQPQESYFPRHPVDNVLLSYQSTGV